MTRSRSSSHYEPASPRDSEAQGHIARREIADAVRAGHEVPDAVFDRFLPTDLRRMSSAYWTPVAAAMVAARWFEEFNIASVLDIGSGAGKFCVVSALAGNCRFVGIEQRPRLVRAARVLAHLFDLEHRVVFRESVFGHTPVPSSDAYYLYNPFCENLYGRAHRLDDDVELTDARFRRDVAAVEALLRRARIGTYLVTLNGFGGRIPPNYQAIRSTPDAQPAMELFRKASGT